MGGMVGCFRSFRLFGIFGVEKADFSWRKMIGMAAAIAGVVLFKWE